jgi:hypothetical protein
MAPGHFFVKRPLRASMQTTLTLAMHANRAASQQVR